VVSLVPKRSFENAEPTSIFREERFADQVEEFDLHTTQILSDFCTFHLAQSNS
jgi:hypothetical protein